MTLKSVSFLLIISGILYGCAKIGPLSGGEKDVTPPVVLSSVPANNSTNFKGHRVEIEFNEFLKFKDKDKVFLTSPPFKKKPTVIIKYKSVVVDFEEDLKANTTYSLNFGSCITDNNEGNPVRDYEFAFSTGNYVDSLSLEGKVVNAFDRKPDKEGFLVMFYDTLGDSVPMKRIPAYQTKTNEKGLFRIHHLKPDTFMVVAIKDKNSNNLYDADEDIAFSDTSMVVNGNYFQLPDTVAAKDTCKTDSAYYSHFKPKITFYSFTPQTHKQYLAKKERNTRNKLFFNFGAPLDTFKISLPDFPDKQNWYLKEANAAQDSITVWITDSTIYKKDTLNTVLIYPKLDSLNIPRPYNDTLSMIVKPVKEAKKTRSRDNTQAMPGGMGFPGGSEKPGNTKKPEKKDMEDNREKLLITTNAKDGFDLNKIVLLEADAPISFIDPDKFHFTVKEDTVVSKVKYTLRRDSMFRKMELDFKPVPNAQYSLIIDSAAIKSVYGTYNDSTGISFKSQKDDYYGAIKIKISNIKEQIIVQVLDEKEKLIKSIVVIKDQEVNLDYLAPGKYLLKVIYDKNGNGKWDTGDFMKRLQPEAVEYNGKPIEVRSNWDVDLTWELGKFK